MRKYVSAIIFWGALWGLEEATLGHLLHIVTINLGWFLWFPLAYFFMGMVYKQTGRLKSVLFTAIIAAAIKLVDLFMTTNLMIIVCPALSIILESLSFVAVLKIACRKQLLQKQKLYEIVSVSALWRVSYVLSLLLIPTWIMPSYPYTSAPSLLKFLLYEGLINSLFIYGVMMLTGNTYFKRLTDKIIQSKLMREVCFKPAVSLFLLAAALIIQLVL